MQLYEEYLCRHKINKPLVSYQHASTVILVGGHMPTRWAIVSVVWSDPVAHPGHYVVEYLRPIHDGYACNKYFEKYNEKDIYWDEYEDYFLQMAQGLKHHVSPAGCPATVPTMVYGSKEILLSLWEMFLFVYDSWMCHQPGELKNYVYSSIHPDASVQERYSGYMESLIYLATKAPAVLKSWKTDFMPFVQNYATWLIDLYRHDERIFSNTNEL